MISFSVLVTSSLIILGFAKKQLWLPGLSSTDDNAPDLSDPLTNSFNIGLSCIDLSSARLNRLPVYHLFQTPPRYSHLLVNLRSLYSEMNSPRAECENLKTERQKFDLLSTLINEGYQSKPRKLFNVD